MSHICQWSGSLPTFTVLVTPLLETSRTMEPSFDHGGEYDEMEKLSKATPEVLSPATVLTSQTLLVISLSLVVLLLASPYHSLRT